MDQKTLRAEVLKFLKSNYTMSIAVSENDVPTSSILLYYVDDNFNFYFATHINSFKVKKLKANPNMSLSIWKANTMLVQVDGIAEEVSDTEKKLSIIDNLAEAAAMDENFWPPLFRIGGDDYIVFKIKPNWMRKLDLVQDTITQEDSPLIEIELN